MSGNTYLNSQTFFKPTYFKALEYIVPNLYKEDDISTFGSEDDLEDQIINFYIDIAASAQNFIGVTPITGTIWSNISSINGIAPYFIKQNNLTEITSEAFNRKILKRVGRSFNQFNTSAQFLEYLEDTLLPSIHLNNPTSYFTLGQPFSSVHSYLIENLSWLYFLNTSGASYSPSSFVKDILIEKTYQGKTITLADCIKGLNENIWKNNPSYIPDTFTSSTGTYTSGTQQLEKFNTWADIVFSPLYSDRANFKVKNKFETFIDSGTKFSETISKGPFYKFLRAISFAAFDSDNDVETLKTLNDIDSCPAKYLPLLAELIGWKLFGSNESRWRLQLRNAVEIYKRVGTKKAIQFAVNTVFPKDLFNIESRLTELWESYIPFLIFYSLATESDYFKSRDSWTRDTARLMGVDTYSNTNFEENIKLSVDKIIYDTYLQFSSSFNIPNKDNEFNYRGRIYPIPPFEEYPYYVNVELSEDMIDFITDRLSCFGVRKQFALDLRDYIISNTLDLDEDSKSANWLFFTSGYSEPPNLGNLITNLHDKKFEYASLWNGKSSHFKLVFDAADFNFEIDDDFSASSGDSIQIASQIVNEFAPAHSIPLVSLNLSAIDYLNSQDVPYPIVEFNLDSKIDTVKGLRNYEASALNLNVYKRTNAAGNVTSRGSYDSLTNPLYVNAASINSVPRNSLRRRNYEKVMPEYGYYDRSGFNMPISLSMESSLSGIPLGFIPSSMQWADVGDPINPSGPYSQCMTLDSSAQLYGYSVSNTLACRGYQNGIAENYYVDRGQLPDIFAVMHEIKEEAKIIEASSYMASNALEDTWKYRAKSFANSATEVSGWFPSSKEDYYNYSFGSDFHQYYNIYCKSFNRHQLAEHMHNLDGPNIYAHTFGSILRNSDFNVLGPNSSQFVTSSLSSIASLQSGGASLFSIQGLSLGSYMASTSYVERPEFVCSSILSGIELTQFSGAQEDGLFTILKIPSAQRSYGQDLYMFDKTFIHMHVAGGQPRVRIDTRTFPCPSSEGHPASSNFLLPDCEYTFSVKALAATQNGLSVGGGGIGIWIHTRPENGSMWSYTKSGWRMHNQVIDIRQLFREYSKIFSFKPSRNLLLENRISEDIVKRLNCIDIVTGTTIEENPLLTFTESDFEEFSVSFDTYNSNLIVPLEYSMDNTQVHRISQNYVFEIFRMPTDRSLLLDKINLVNDSLSRMSQILVSGTPLHYPLRRKYCPEYRVGLSKPQIQTIFKFFNDISGKNSSIGYASRNSFETSSLMYSNGGSRLDYRTIPAWDSPLYFSGVDPNLYIEFLTTKL
jgi:hypothetical protein